MSLTYQLPSSIEFYLKADFSFTVAKLIISPSLLLLVRIVSSTFLFTEIVVLSRALTPVSDRAQKKNGNCSTRGKKGAMNRKGLLNSLISG